MSNEPKASMNLDPEMLAAYIDKRLSPEQRAAVEAQLAADPDAHLLLVEAMKAQDALGGVEIGRTRHRRGWVIASSVFAIAAAIVLAVWAPDILERIRGSRLDPRFARLVAAVGNDRYVEARLTGGFPYGPPPVATRGAGTGAASNLSLLAAAGELQQAAAQNPTPETLHAWGVAQVLLGQLDGAIESLTAAAAGSNDRAIQSDLAGAYVTRATVTGRADDWPRALSAATKAVEGEPSPPIEALFNRALAAEALHLTAVAQQAWEAYLARESQPEWRAEAERHLQQLRTVPQSWRDQQQSILDAAARADRQALSAAAKQYPQKLRETIEDEWLRRWADDTLRADAAAPALMPALARLADALAEQTGDDLLARTAHAIEALDAAPRAEIAAGLVQYAAGRDAYERAAMQDSVAPFTSARALFARHRLPLADWCDLYLATASYYRGDYPSALAQTSAELTRIGSQPFLALRARLVWLQGLMATQQGDYDRSLARYSEALALFERMGELENQAAVHSLLATAYLYVGDEDSVWAHTVRSLQTRSADSSFRRQHMILVGAANRATRLDLPEAALAFTDEAEDVNSRWNDAIAGVEIANYRARTLLQLDRPGDAAAAVAGARAALPRIADAGLRQRAEAEVMQSEAEALAAADPQAGIAAATRAIDYFSATRSALRVPRLYATRAAARQRAGDADGALADLRAGADRFDAERATLPRSERLRLAYSDEVWNTYRQLVAAEIDRGASCAVALGAAERARATTLQGGFDAPAVIAGVGERTAVVSYTFIDSRLAIIVLRAGRCDYRIANVSQLEVRERLAALRTELSRRDGPRDAGSASARFFQDVLLPVWSLVDGADRIEIIADGPLHYLPFAALRLPDGSRLIEKLSIRMIAGMSAVRSPARASRTAAISSGGEVRALNLPPLPGVQAEIAAVKTTLAAAGVTAQQVDDAPAFMSRLRTADIVHFAGHAVINQDYPLLSRLVLSGRDADQWVTAEQIAAIGPITPRLVFLSACSTQAGRSFGGEGPASLARSFLAAGAGEVVASLWPVADPDAPALVGAFYREWSASGDAADALRRAVVAAIRDGAHTPDRWAAWVVVGRRSDGPRAPNRSTN